jgi:tubulin-specific chaperone A
MYRKEAEDQKRKLDKLVADGAEDWDIKNGVCALCTDGSIL